MKFTEMIYFNEEVFLDIQNYTSTSAYIVNLESLDEQKLNFKGIIIFDEALRK